MRHHARRKRLRRPPPMPCWAAQIDPATKDYVWGDARAVWEAVRSAAGSFVNRPTFFSLVRIAMLCGVLTSTKATSTLPATTSGTY
jgi:hypothetical protein